MDLEVLNNEYQEFSNRLKTENVEVDRIKKEADDLRDDKKIQESLKIQAERLGNNTAKANAEAEIKRITKEIEKKLVELNKQKSKALVYKNLIEQRKREIREDPQMKAHLDEVSRKTYSRKIKAIEKEKEENLAKKERLTKSKDLLMAHPSLANNVVGMSAAKAKIEKAEGELASLPSTVDPATGTVVYTDPIKAQSLKDEIKDNKAKYKKNYDSINAYITKHGGELTIDDIVKTSDEMSKTGVVLDKDGKPDVGATFDKSIRKVDRQIRGNNKSIDNYNIALTTVQRGIDDRADAARAAEAADKPKWWQFIKRFRNWRESRNAPSLPEGTTPEAPAAGNDNPYLESLKYDIVKRVREDKEKEEIKEAKETRKELYREAREDDEGER